MKKLILILMLGSILSCVSESKEKEEGQEETQKANKTEQVVEYYADGVKKVEGKMVNGERHGKWIFYYENGYIWSEGMFKNGKRKGYSVVYHENGRKKLAGEYKDNQKVGVWKVYGKDGALLKEVNLDEEPTQEEVLSLEIE